MPSLHDEIADLQIKEDRVLAGKTLGKDYVRGYNDAIKMALLIIDDKTAEEEQLNERLAASLQRLSVTLGVNPILRIGQPPSKLGEL